MKQIYLITTGLVFQAMSGTVAAVDNWEVRVEHENGTRCILESATQVFNDGQAETVAKLVYTGEALYAATQSNINLQYPGIGLQVDGLEQHPVDGVYMLKTAVFSKNVETIHQQFIHGIKAKVTLGFWPLIPQTKTYDIEFSLIGYTKAYHQYLECKKKEE